MNPKRQMDCPQCGTKAIRIDEYDSYACRKCVIWLGNPCSDPECEFCAERPDYPSDVDWDDKWNT